MNSLYGSSLALFIAVFLPMSSCAFSQSFSSGTSVVNGGSWSSGTNSFSTNQAAIAVQTNNGVIEVTLDGKKINLAAATVISDDGNTKVYQPLEEPEARIAVDRENNVTVDFKGAHYETPNPMKISQQIQNQMMEMNNRFRSLFPPFPQFPFNF